jgi:hypothetical protein
LYFLYPSLEKSVAVLLETVEFDEGEMVGVEMSGLSEGVMLMGGGELKVDEFDEGEMVGVEMSGLSEGVMLMGGGELIGDEVEDLS